jgi:hypothetical protein
VKTIVSKINRFVERSPPGNSCKPFDCHNKEDPTTVSQFNKQLHQLVATHGLTNSATNDLLTLLRDNTSSLDLPLSASDKTPFNTKPIVGNTICSFIDSDVNDFTTNICRHECMVFRGMQKDPHPDKDGVYRMRDCSELLECMFCHSPRFTKCCNVRCKAKRAKYLDCDPFKGGHSLDRRVSMRDVYYRTIIGKLIQLYCLSLMDGFEAILKYDGLRVAQDGKIIDILDGAEFIQQQRNMSANFDKVHGKWKTTFPDRGELHECSLMLTVSYDGVVNFKRKMDSMWPMMTSVVNCNPTHRAKLGTGMFLTMLHNCSVGSGVEKHMMEDMLVAELRKLETGLIFTIPASSVSPDRHVYLQARLLFCHLDTKAMEKCGMLKLSNSLYGCQLCNLQTGSTRPSLSKCVYTGTRLPLYKHHVLRCCGQREFQDQLFDEELKYAAGKRRPKKPKDFSYNGVHGVASMIGGLATYELGNLCPDPMHCLSNISSNHIQVWKKERALSDGSRLLANGFISQSLTKGGVRYLSTMYNRYVIKDEFQDQLFDETVPLRPEYTAAEMSRMYYQGDTLYSDILKAECSAASLEPGRRKSSVTPSLMKCVCSGAKRQNIQADLLNAHCCFVQRINAATFNITQKLNRHWMKINNRFHDV